MKWLGLAVVLGVMLTPLGAETVRWTATGEVTGVVTDGEEGVAPLGIMGGQQVEVEFSYLSGTNESGINGLLGYWEEVGIWGPMGLAVTVRIGGHRWVAQVSERPGESPYVMVIGNTFALVPNGDEFHVSLGSTVGAVLPSFPGASATGDNNLTLHLEDKESPFEFLGSSDAPRAMDPVLGEITSATGMITAGAESIAFTIDPASITIVDDPIGGPVEAEIVVANGEVTLAWDAKIGVEYTIHWSENGRQWEVLRILAADEVDETHTFSAVNGAPGQYYQVSKDG